MQTKRKTIIERGYNVVANSLNITASSFAAIAPAWLRTLSIGDRLEE